MVGAVFNDGRLLIPDEGAEIRAGRSPSCQHRYIPVSSIRIG